MGGGVRDLLLNRQPKDFDIATDASPEQVRALFGNARIIGRRFRLVHVRFRDEIVEVATFRGLGNEDLESEDRQILDAAGRIIKDNSFGSIEEDAWRRDFTVNALYYNIADFSIWDFVDGMRDIEARTDPADRRSGDPLPGGPGAHDPGGAARREAGPARFTRRPQRPWRGLAA